MFMCNSSEQFRQQIVWLFFNPSSKVDGRDLSNLDSDLNLIVDQLGFCGAHWSNEQAAAAAVESNSRRQVKIEMFSGWFVVLLISYERKNTWTWNKTDAQVAIGFWIRLRQKIWFELQFFVLNLTVEINAQVEAKQGAICIKVQSFCRLPTKLIVYFAIQFDASAQNNEIFGIFEISQRRKILDHVANKILWCFLFEQIFSINFHQANLHH